VLLPGTQLNTALQQLVMTWDDIGPQAAVTMLQAMLHRKTASDPKHKGLQLLSCGLDTDNKRGVFIQVSLDSTTACPSVSWAFC
jgi:hypothetical protein